MIKTPLVHVTIAASVLMVVGTPSALAQAGGGQRSGNAAGQSEDARRAGRREEPGGRGGWGGAWGGGGPGGMFGGRNNFEPAITTRSLESYTKLLGLSPDQQSAAKALLEGYQQSFDTLAGEARDRMQEMREAIRAEMADEGGGRPGGDAFRRMGDEMDKFRKARTELEDGFFNDLKAVLTPEQSDKWPRVERAHRREQTVGRGLMSGERLDLVKVVDDLKLDPAARAELEPVLDQYAAELDRKLIDRNAAYDAVQVKMRAMFQNADDTGIEKAFQDGREASTGVRDVNRKYVRQIEGLLPDDAKPAFNEVVRRQSYPLIYRQTYGSRALAAASELTDLDDAQKATITSIRESYARDLAGINRELEAATDKREQSLNPQDLMRRRGGGGWRGDLENDPDLAPLIERRNALQDSALDKLKAALTPEQFAALPQRGSERRSDNPDGDGAGDRPRRNRDRDDRPNGAPRPPSSRPGPV